MSSGTVHAKASIILASTFTVASLYNPRILECAAGAMAGILLSPDLDLDARNISYKIIRKRSLFGEKLWSWFWRGYRKSFKHGQFASHFPIFSTFVRLFYIYFWIILVPHVFLKLPFLMKLSPIPQWDLMFVLSWYAKIFLSWMFVYGLMASDVIHWALDALTVEHKK